MAQSRQSESQRSGGGGSGKNRDQDRSARSGQEMGNRQKSGGDGAASGSATKDVMAQAQDQAGTMVEQARQQATTQLSSQKERAASTLGTLAGALHEASRQVREQDDAMMAGYIDTAASQVDSLADTIKQQDLGQIIDSAGRFARRQPAVFLAGAIAVGFIGARFLKSSAQSSSQDKESSGYGYGYGSYRGQSGAYGSDMGSGDAAGAMGRSAGNDAPRYGSEGSLGYGSAMSASAASDFASTTGSGSGAGSGTDWQTRSAFDSGREGQ